MSFTKIKKNIIFLTRTNYSMYQCRFVSFFSFCYIFFIKLKQLLILVCLFLCFVFTVALEMLRISIVFVINVVYEVHYILSRMRDKVYPR